MKNLARLMALIVALATAGAGCGDDDSGARCGNGKIDPSLNEACDGDSLGGRQCTDFGYRGGTLACHPPGSTDECQYDYTQCTGLTCGDNFREGNEACDGVDLDGKTCVDFGHDGGPLGCYGPEDANPCTFDTSGCLDSPFCGDGTVDTSEGEQCDGSNLNGQSCISQGYLGGTLRCDTQCRFDTSQCTAPVCGNDTREATELCDGTDLDGQNCITRGYIEGTLACASDCTAFDETGCSGTPVCGNNIREGLETCDGTDLAGQSCQSQGFLEGSLACYPDGTANECTFDTSGCSGSALCTVDHNVGLLQVNAPQSVNGDLVTANNDNYVSCNWDQWVATDVVIYISTAVLADLKVDFVFGSTYPWHFLALFQAGSTFCDDNELSCFETYDQTGSHVFPSLQPGGYYLILETESGGTDPYDLTLTLELAEICDNNVDDDSDGLTDCQETDRCCTHQACSGDPSCTGFDGQPCTADASCLGGICLEELTDGFPGGLCTRDCSVTGICPGDFQCQTGPTVTTPICLPPCLSGNSSDCRNGYTCVGFSGLEPFCYPDCNTNAECVDTSTCNVESGLCHGPQSLTALGGPCVDPEDCESGFCFDESGMGAPGGICTSLCRLSAPVCPGDGVCVDIFTTTADSGFCLDGCAQQSDCRTGYTCQANQYNPPPNDSVCDWM